MFAILGEIQFDLIAYVDGLSGEYKTDFAEHALIEGKPKLQFIGQALDQYSFEFTFHSMFCNPDQEMQRIKVAKENRMAMPFVLGSGEYKGLFVITELAETLQQTTNDGSVIASSAVMTIREYVGEITEKQNGLAVNPAGIPAGSVGKSLVATTNSFQSNLKNAVSYANKAKSVVSTIKQGVQMVTSIRRDPAYALRAIPNLTNQVSNLSKTLGVAASSGAKITNQWPAIETVVSTANQAMSLANDITNILKSSHLDNVLSSFDAAERVIQSIDSNFNRTKATVNKATAMLATRQV